MKIVFVGPFGLQPKTTMKVRALPMAKALVNRGHVVTLLIPPWDDPQRSGLRWIEDGVEIININLPPRLPGLFHVRITQMLVTKILRLQPDVVHCFKPKAYAGLTHFALWILRLLRVHKTRLVVDADDWEQAWNEIIPYTPSQKRFFVWQEEWGLNNADVVTVASRALERMVGKEGTRMEAALRKVFYIPNGSIVDFDDLPEVSTESVQHMRQKWSLKDNPTILLLSRFQEFRLTRLVTIVEQVSLMMPEARWLIVGKGLQGEEQRLAQMLNEEGLGDCVHFTGWVPYDDLPLYFHAADVAVHPYDDTLISRTKCSIKLIELLSAELPVVADAVGQNLEYIPSEKHGLLVPAEDDLAFSQAIVKLLQAPDWRHQMGETARQYIQQHFDWARLVETVEKAYRA